MMPVYRRNLADRGTHGKQVARLQQQRIEFHIPGDGVGYRVGWVDAVLADQAGRGHRVDPGFQSGQRGRQVSGKEEVVVVQERPVAVVLDAGVAGAG